MTTHGEWHTRAALIIGNDVQLVEARVTLQRDDDGIHWRVGFAGSELGADAELVIDEGPGGAVGHLRLGDETARLFDEVQLVQARLPGPDGEIDLVGLRGEYSFAHHGRFRRLRQVVVAVSDAEIIDALVAAWDPDARQQVVQLPWTIDSLTRFAAARARRMPEVRNVEIVDAGQLRVTADDGEHLVELGNLFANVRTAGGAALDDIEAFLAGAVRVATGPVADHDVMFRLMAAPSPVRVQVAMDGRPHELELASVAVGDELSAVFVRDTPTSMQYIEAGELAGMQRSAAELVTLAGENLMRSLPRIHIRGEGPLFMIIAGGNYECSLAVLPSFWDAMEPLLDAPALVAMPARDLCLIVPDRDGLLEQLRAHVDGLGELAYALTNTIHRVRDHGRWFEAVG